MNNNENKTSISVIVPIYNVGEYLYRCLSSLACQTFKNYEVIMINDGSTDQSGDIAKGFADSFKNFNLFQNPDKGVSSARNLGISLAQGEYIAFVDSDDYIDPNYLLRLYDAAKLNNADVVHCNYILYNIENGFLYSPRIRKPKEGIMTNIQMVKKTISDFYMRSYLWNKLWHRSLFTQHGITFPNMKFEDIATVSKLLYYANKGVILNQYLYYYTKRDGSIVQTVSLKNLQDYILSLGILRKFFAEKHELRRLERPFEQLGLAMFFSNSVGLVRLHFRCKNFKGLFKNIRYTYKNISYFFSKKFINSQSDSVSLPYPFIQPEDKNVK